MYCDIETQEAQRGCMTRNSFALSCTCKNWIGNNHYNIVSGCIHDSNVSKLASIKSGHTVFSDKKWPQNFCQYSTNMKHWYRKSHTIQTLPMYLYRTFYNYFWSQYNYFPSLWYVYLLVTKPNEILSFFLVTQNFHKIMK